MFTAGALARSTKAITAVTTRPVLTATFKPTNTLRPITSSTKLYKEDKRSSLPSHVDPHDTTHEGQFSRTDNKVSIGYPEEHELPRSAPVQGRGAIHFKRTLSSFSLEGRSCVVTGGARGLGLVMSQACVISGADVALVDLNSKAHGAMGKQKVLT